MITFIRGKYGAGLKRVVKVLKDEHGIHADVVKTNDPTLVGKGANIMVCWGITEYPDGIDFDILFNPPDMIQEQVNKLDFFRANSGILPLVPWTESKWIAQQWITALLPLYARQKLSSSGGKGIVYVDKLEDLVDAPLYTMRIPGKEYRVHLDVYGGKIIDIAQKRKMTTEKLEAKGYTFNKYIKSHKNGWVHSHKDIDPLPDGVEEQILRDFKDYPLDFVAVDLIIPKDYDGLFELEKYRVLEVNTAPGLVQSQTIRAYADMFARYCQEVE